MKKYLLNLLLIIIFFLVCLDFYKKNAQIFIAQDFKIKPYEKFYKNINKDILEYKSNSVHFNRAVNIDKYNALEDRKKLRWVFNMFHSEVQILIKNISDKQKYISKERFSLYLYSSFLGVVFFSIFLFIYLSLMKLKKNSSIKERIDSSKTLSYLVPSYLLIIIYIFFYHFRGDYSVYAIFETLLLVSGFYFCLKRNIYIFGLICIFAPCVRTSGILISFLYIVLDYSKNSKINFKYLIFPALSILVFLLINIDLINYLFVDGFLVTSKEISGQITYHMFFSGGFLNAFQALLYNYVFLFIPILIFWGTNKSQIFVLILIIAYLFILLLGTAIEDMSEKFMPASLLLIYCFLKIYKIPKFFKDS
tara:strand:- start:432 stop:1523 length:1092 start_codon:yes stop_codon:yes gene_type:complete